LVEKETRAKHAARPKEKNKWTRPNHKRTFKQKDRVGQGYRSLGVKPSYALHWVETTNQAGPSAKRPAAASEHSGDQDPTSTAQARVTEKIGGFTGDAGSDKTSKELSGVTVSATSMASVIPESSGEMGHAFSAPVRPKVPVGGMLGGGGALLVPSGAAFEVPLVLFGGVEETRREGCLDLGSLGSTEGVQKGRGEAQEASGEASTEYSSMRGVAKPIQLSPVQEEKEGSMLAMEGRDLCAETPVSSRGELRAAVTEPIKLQVYQRSRWRSSRPRWYEGTWCSSG
jgi:hypothetical protein